MRRSRQRAIGRLRRSGAFGSSARDVRCRRFAGSGEAVQARS